MPRLFIKDVPSNITVVHGLKDGSFTIRVNDLVAAGVTVNEDSLDACYLGIVADGKCWAGRNFYIHASRTLVRVVCADFSDTDLGKQMVLADMILD